MSALLSWERSDFTAVGITHPVHRKGSGPGVIVIHEVPGLTPQVIAFGEELVAAGYTTVLPELFGRNEEPLTGRSAMRTLAKVCVSREFHVLAAGKTTPVAGWLRALARSLHADLGGPGVGALGMCFTGGFALAMMLEDAVVAPVLAQPSTPFAIGRHRSADLGLSPADLEAVRVRCSRGQEVLGLRYLSDPAVGTRFTTLTEELGSAFLKVELAGKGHSTLTNERQQEAVDAVLAFFSRRLR
ncbi:MAG: dienelactone hydrolase family protein [Nocardioides sp.]